MLKNPVEIKVQFTCLKLTIKIYKKNSSIQQ